jgi:hypothetical protein
MQPGREGMLTAISGDVMTAFLLAFLTWLMSIARILLLLTKPFVTLN